LRGTVIKQYLNKRPSPAICSVHIYGERQPLFKLNGCFLISSIFKGWNHTKECFKNQQISPLREMDIFDKVLLKIAISTNPTLNMFITNHTYATLKANVKIISVSCTDIVTCCFNLRVNAYLFLLILHFVDK
jgi:hypothetical protein